jgi:hypothetical protein
MGTTSVISLRSRKPWPTRWVLAPHAKLRAAIIPQPTHKDSAPVHEHAHGKAARMRWAQLLERVFAIDVERCACGGKLKIIAAIEEPVVVARILTHLGCPRRPLRSTTQPDPGARRRFCGRTDGRARPAVA